MAKNQREAQGTQYIEVLVQRLLAINVFKNMEALIQTVPRELLLALQQAEAIQGTQNLSLEVAVRLLATYVCPKAFGFNPEVETLLTPKFSYARAKIEHAKRCEDWICVYELEKLKLYVEFEHRLPKAYQEKFNKIDVKHAIKCLRQEVKKRRDEANKTKNNGEEGEVNE